MHGDVTIAQRLERENLSIAGISLSSEYVSSPIEWSFRSLFFQSVAIATLPGRCVVCRTFQSYMIDFERKHFSLRGSVDKCATRNVKFRKY